MDVQTKKKRQKLETNRMPEKNIGSRLKNKQTDKKMDRDTAAIII